MSFSPSQEQRKGNVKSALSAKVSSSNSYEYKFIHFGCWNNEGCGDKYPGSGLTSTMQLLNNYLQTTTPEIVLVTGDNYYPSKKKIKILRKKNLFQKFLIRVGIV